MVTKLGTVEMSIEDYPYKLDSVEIIIKTPNYKKSLIIEKKYLDNLAALVYNYLQDVNNL